MTRMWIGALALAMTMTFTGCGTETKAAATVTDAGAIADTGAGTDTGAATDTGSAADTTGATDTGTATTDTGSAQADTTQPDDKCAPTDQACLQTCGTKVCAAELTGCNSDKGCSGLITCLNGCTQGVPAPKPSTAVTMPDGSMPTTCNDFCIAGAGKASYDKLSTMQLCVQGKCIKSIPGETSDCVPNTPSYNTCVNTCATIKCIDEINTCNASKDCTGLLTCLGGCNGNQGCQQTCVANSTQAGTQEYQAAASCVQTNCIKQ